ncbi:UvrD-helicase domain-containing protein [Shewanella psychromarinicola]|uniref:RecBCD enzyme subunit RecB n=1 Tax=Shewanella psychromarinicola TaxID=2487742 RepID=A0A3N4DM20_9GAMM|nr:UvrD-helicase domain-containing protein [Shewanella psychromarinicola]AZG35753.1 exodeoxyribonuclease V subunit beta [Shewanella psychromarinicola]MCL1083952.1 UvrD-helicase domain-containing protein [Shewanella psychromarinicola]RPA22660.1 exodeoxyribonuclease V subunit beta [Shewanella psychromarinicola]
MEPINVAPLNALTLPFSGSSLIEASAGTGKTYTISGLYLRLLLGHGEQSPLSCEQILVVTFTNAATEELRDRIRKRINLAFKRFLGLAVNDDFIEQLYQDTSEAERPIALRRLDLALKSLDEAAIFTIHAFCQRVLSDMAFESSLLFESEFTLDDSEFLHHAVRDFWREVCYPLPPFLAQAISDVFAEPDVLAQKLRPLLGASQAVLSKQPPAFEKLQQQLSQSISRFTLLWQSLHDNTLELLQSLPLNGQRFGKAADGYPKLSQLFDSVTNWVKFGQGLPPLKALEQLALSELKLNKGGVIPTATEAPLLDHIERLLELINELIPSFLVRAREGIRQRFAGQKQQRNLMTPDDLLLSLAMALSQNPITLAHAIAKRFPVALIDEFQDTDPLQFTIFNQVYQQPLASQLELTPDTSAKAQQNDTPKGHLSLLMIGDPKQAIYAFRGADIYTYIAARQQTQAHYNLDTNYRSSTQLVNGVNQLFSQHDDPFISQAIPYDSVKTPSSAANKHLSEAKPNPAALRIRLLAEDDVNGLNKTTARQRLAADAASEIKRLLTEAQQGLCKVHASLDRPGEPLIAKDIAILVRDRNEAAIMKAALSARKIGAVFLSRDSVFNTIEAREMAILLYALATPKDERAIRAALATELVGFNAQRIHQFNQNEEQRQHVLDQFLHWHQLWQQRGVMPALLNFASETQLIHRYLSQSLTSEAIDVDDHYTSIDSNFNDADEDNAADLKASGERRLTDFRHLAELLQQKATELDGSSALINWYEQQLIGNNGGDEQQLRLESEQNLVQIVTIHKSKGLEYPVCFVPFVSLARGNKKRPAPMMYHKNEQLIWDVDATDEGWEQLKQETLAEDLRLLYVALTRPVYVCYVYIANQSRQLKAGISSQLHETGIGYLLGITDKKTDFALIQARVNAIATLPAMSVQCLTSDIDDSVLADINDNNDALMAKKVNRAKSLAWRVGSYSGLVKHLPHERVAPGADDEDFSDELIQLQLQDDVITEPVLDRFSFERGANAGSFMHLVLELFDFTQADSELPPALAKAMKQYGFDETLWHDPLTTWYQQILTAPLFIPPSFSAPLITASASEDASLSAIDNSQAQPTSAVTLSQLGMQQKMVEMEFYLPISTLQASKLNHLLQQHGYVGGLDFDTLKGMLKGFIDLTFEHQGQFFIADYKSNHLGDKYSDYTHSAMAKAIDSHRYNLQYILYTLALHRYLSLRLPGYHYQQHIGGCYYLFLRGMHPQHPGAGVFYDKPPQALIEQLDRLFSGQTDNRAPETSSC